MPILLLFVGRDGEAGSAFGLNDGLQPWQQGPPEAGNFNWSEDELRAAIRTQLEVAYIDGAPAEALSLRAKQFLCAVTYGLGWYR